MRNMFRRGGEAGYSLMELLAVLLILGIGTAILYGEWLRGERLAAEKATAEILRAVDDCRTNARNGLESATLRSVDFKAMRLPRGAQWRTDINPQDLPFGMPALDTSRALTFERQTGRTENGVWGYVAVRDQQKTELIFIPKVQGPLMRFKQFNNAGRFVFVPASGY